MGRARGEVEVPTPALRVEARQDRDCLDQRGLAHAVLTHEKRHAGIELQRAEIPESRDREGVDVKVGHLLAQERQLPNEAVLAEAGPTFHVPTITTGSLL